MLKIIKAIILTIWFIFGIVIWFYMLLTDNNANILTPVFMINIAIPFIFLIADEELLRIELIKEKESDDNGDNR